MEESLTFILLILFLGMNSHEHFAKANALRLFVLLYPQTAQEGFPSEHVYIWYYVSVYILCFVIISEHISIYSIPFRFTLFCFFSATVSVLFFHCSFV